MSRCEARLSQRTPGRGQRAWVVAVVLGLLASCPVRAELIRPISVDASAGDAFVVKEPEKVQKVIFDSTKSSVAFNDTQETFDSVPGTVVFQRALGQSIAVNALLGDGRLAGLADARSGVITTAPEGAFVQFSAQSFTTMRFEVMAAIDATYSISYFWSIYGGMFDPFPPNPSADIEISAFFTGSLFDQTRAVYVADSFISRTETAGKGTDVFRARVRLDPGIYTLNVGAQAGGLGRSLSGQQGGGSVWTGVSVSLSAVTPVPEPTSLHLLALGMALTAPWLAVRRRASRRVQGARRRVWHLTL